MTWRRAKCVSTVLVAFAGLSVAWLGLALYLNKGRCIVLPDGYMIGYSSIIKRDQSIFWEMVLRDPTGKVLVTTDYMMRFVRHPNDDQRVLARFPGNIELDLPGEELMPAVLYIHPYGAERVEPEYHSASWPKISQGLPEGASLGWLGISLLYEKLELSKKFEMVNCGTPWFDRGQ
ncbi:MAG: hypothetical protein AAGF48_10985 [Pseudomonadota bacterium]